VLDGVARLVIQPPAQSALLRSGRRLGNPRPNVVCDRFTKYLDVYGSVIQQPSTGARADANPAFVILSSVDQVAVPNLEKRATRLKPN